MTDNKFKPINKQFNEPFIPQTETRIFLGGRPIDQQTEQISSRGNHRQHYQSEKAEEINPNYGPCSYSGCSYSERFYLKVGFGQTKFFNWHFKDFSGVINGGQKFDWLVFTDIQEARNGLEKLKQGTHEVVGATGDWNTSSARERKEKIMFWIQTYINTHQGSGVKIEEDMNFTDHLDIGEYEGTNMYWND